MTVPAGIENLLVAGSSLRKQPETSTIRLPRLCNSMKLFSDESARANSSLRPIDRYGSGHTASTAPGEPPFRELAAQASALPSPNEGRTKTNECPAPSAITGQGKPSE